jgi:hypothetical protein
MASDPRHDVVKKDLTDPAFKAELLKDPRAAIEKATGVKVPAGTTIKVVEDSASTVHLVLPAERAKGALSESELGKVAGGGGGGYTQRGYCDNTAPVFYCQS